MKNSNVSILDKVTEKIYEVFCSEVVDIGVNMNLRDVGLDSVKTIELIVNLEIEFDIEINDEDLLIENFTSINKISKLLLNKYGISEWV